MQYKKWFIKFGTKPNHPPTLGHFPNKAFFGGGGTSLISKNATKLSFKKMTMMMMMDPTAMMMKLMIWKYCAGKKTAVCKHFNRVYSWFSIVSELQVVSVEVSIIGNNVTMDGIVETVSLMENLPWFLALLNKTPWVRAFPGVSLIDLWKFYMVQDHSLVSLSNLWKFYMVQDHSLR